MPFSTFLAYSREQERHERHAFADAILSVNLGSHGEASKLDSLLQSLRK